MAVPVLRADGISVPLGHHQLPGTLVQSDQAFAKLAPSHPLGETFADESKNTLLAQATPGCYYSILNLIRAGWFKEASGLLPPLDRGFIFRSEVNMREGLGYERLLEKTLAGWSAQEKNKAQVYRVQALCQLWVNSKKDPPETSPEERLSSLGQRFALEAPTEPLPRCECLIHLAFNETSLAFVKDEIERQIAKHPVTFMRKNPPVPNPGEDIFGIRNYSTLEERVSQLRKHLILRAMAKGDVGPLHAHVENNLKIALREQSEVGPDQVFHPLIGTGSTCQELLQVILSHDREFAAKLCPQLAKVVALSFAFPDPRETRASMDPFAEGSEKYSSQMQTERARFLVVTMVAYAQAGLGGDYARMLETLPTEAVAELKSNPEIYGFEQVLASWNFLWLAPNAPLEEQREISFFYAILRSEELCDSLTPIRDLDLIFESNNFSEKALFAVIDQLEDTGRKAFFVMQRGAHQLKYPHKRSMALADFEKMEEISVRTQEVTGIALARLLQALVLGEAQKFAEARGVLQGVRREDLPTDYQKYYDGSLEYFPKKKLEEKTE